MVMFYFGPHYMAFTFFSKFALHVFATMCLTSMTIISWYHKHFYTKDNAFINYWKLSHNLFTDIKILYINTILHAEIWSKRCISHPYFYGNVINKVEKFQSDKSKLVKALKNVIRKGYGLATIVYVLKEFEFEL